MCSARRVRLTRDSRIVGGSAAWPPGSLRHLSLLGCVSLVPTSAGPLHILRSALHRETPRLLQLRLTSAGASRRLTASLALRHTRRSPGVRRVTFSPSARRIYVRSVRMDWGFRFHCTLTPQASASMRFVFLGPGICLRLPPHLASRRRGCRSARSTLHRGLQGTFTPKSLPVRLSPCG